MAARLRARMVCTSLRRVLYWLTDNIVIDTATRSRGCSAAWRYQPANCCSTTLIRVNKHCLHVHGSLDVIECLYFVTGYTTKPSRRSAGYSVITFTVVLWSHIALIIVNPVAVIKRSPTAAVMLKACQATGLNGCSHTASAVTSARHHWPHKDISI